MEQNSKDIDAFSSSLVLLDLMQVANFKNEDGIPLIEYVSKPNGGSVAYVRHDAMVNRINALIKDYKQFQSEQKPSGVWVKVEDSLPQDEWDIQYPNISKQKLVSVDNGSVGCAAYNREKNTWFLGGLTKECGYIEFERTKVTHWKDLPAHADESTQKPLTDAEWLSEKPGFDKECLVIAACLFSNEWEYEVYQIKKAESEDGWYWGWFTGDGDEYGDLEDFTAQKYLVLPLIK